MGIVIGVEAVVGVAEAAEVAGAAAEAGGEIAGIAEAVPIIEAGGEAGAAAGSEAGAEAAGAAEEGGGALANVLSKITQAIEKLSHMVQEYIVIDQVFKAAKSILEQLFSDPAAKVLVEKLKVLTDALTKCTSLIADVTNWIKEHADDRTTLGEYDIPLSGVLSKFLPQLGSATKLLIVLSQQVSNKNNNKEYVTIGEVDTLKYGIEKSLEAFQQLNEFKKENVEKIKELADIPIEDEKIAAIQQLLANS